MPHSAKILQTLAESSAEGEQAFRQQKIAILDSLKAPFLESCRSVASQLNAKEGLVSKYYKLHPEIDDARLKQDQIKRENFLNNVKQHEGDVTFDEFYEHVKKSLSELTAKDLETLGEKNETEAARAFRECFDFLNQSGFYNVNGSPVNFWSTPPAQEKANTNEQSLSDSNVPAISLMIQLGVMALNEEKKPENHTEQKTKLSDMLFSGSSAELAVNASGIVTLFMPQVMQAHNFNWSAELVRLQNYKGKLSNLSAAPQ